jgi:hypothetical protein
MGQARIGDEVACLAKLSSMRLWFGDGRESSAFNIHMLGEWEIDDFTCLDKEIVR